MKILIFLTNILFCLGRKDSMFRILAVDDQVINLNMTNVPVIRFPECRNNADCSDNGVCNAQTKKCDCLKGYDTVIENQRFRENLAKKLQANIGTDSTYPSEVKFSHDEIKYCNYLLKDQLTAFMLSLLVGFGAEHFYLERFNTAIAKLVFYILCCGFNIFFFIIYMCCPSKKKIVEFIGVFEAFYLICGWVCMVLWTTYDLVNIGYNDYRDGYSMKMLSWTDK